MPCPRRNADPPPPLNTHTHTHTHKFNHTKDCAAACADRAGDTFCRGIEFKLKERKCVGYYAKDPFYSSRKNKPSGVQVCIYSGTAGASLPPS